MIIFGRKATRINTFSAPHSKCDYCGNNGTQQIAVFGKYFHVFWIPLFGYGKTTVSECQHCKKTLEVSKTTNNLDQVAIAEIGNTKFPKWYFSGLFIIGGIFLISFLVNTFSEKDPRADMLLQDMNSMVSEPDMKKDSISYKIKSILDVAVEDGIDPEKFKYFTKINGDKVLMLLQVPDLKKVEKSSRKDLIDIINTIADEQQDLQNKSRYIAVKGKVTTMLVKTPTAEENSTVASESSLYEFYGTKNKE